MRFCAIISDCMINTNIPAAMYPVCGSFSAAMFVPVTHNSEKHVVKCPPLYVSGHLFRIPPSNPPTASSVFGPWSLSHICMINLQIEETLPGRIGN